MNLWFLMKFHLFVVVCLRWYIIWAIVQCTVYAVHMIAVTEAIVYGIWIYMNSYMFFLYLIFSFSLASKSFNWCLYLNKKNKIIFIFIWNFDAKKIVISVKSDFYPFLRDDINFLLLLFLYKSIRVRWVISYGVEANLATNQVNTIEWIHRATHK